MLVAEVNVTCDISVDVANAMSINIHNHNQLTCIST